MKIEKRRRQKKTGVTVRIDPAHILIVVVVVVRSFFKNNRFSRTYLDELLLRNVFALPNASNPGFADKTRCAIPPIPPLYKKNKTKIYILW